MAETIQPDSHETQVRGLADEWVCAIRAKELAQTPSQYEFSTNTTGTITGTRRLRKSVNADFPSPLKEAP